MFSKERMEALFISWANSVPSTIYEAYKCPSSNKIREYALIKQDKNNHGVSVMSATCQFFSAGYVREEDGKLWFVYNTGRYKHVLDLSGNRAWLDMAYEHLSANQEWPDISYEHLQALGNEQ